MEDGAEQQAEDSRPHEDEQGPPRNQLRVGSLGVQLDHFEELRVEELLEV